MYVCYKALHHFENRSRNVKQESMLLIERILVISIPCEKISELTFSDFEILIVVQTVTAKILFSVFFSNDHPMQWIAQ